MPFQQKFAKNWASKNGSINHKKIIIQANIKMDISIHLILFWLHLVMGGGL
jgi:hypothetical protein